MLPRYKWLDRLLLLLAALMLLATVVSFWHLPYFTVMTTGKYDHVDYSLYRGSLCVAYLRFSGIGVAPERGWRWHHFLNETAPADSVWLEYGGYLDEMEWVGWGSVYRVPLLVVALVFAFRPVIRVVRHLRRRGLGLCTGCGYDLTGNVSGRCPECGQEWA